MEKSINVTFKGKIIKDVESPHGPEGADLVRTFRDILSRTGYRCGDIDLWRDSGWNFVCEKNREKIEIVLIKLLGTNDWWLVGIWPEYLPGIFARLFGNKPSATPDSCFDIGKELETMLLKENFVDLKWRWDGFPNDKYSTNKPVAPRQD